MKLINITLFIALLFAYSSASGQCNNSLIDHCKEKLTKTTYLKHFKVRFAKSTKRRKASAANFSVYLNKGNIYKFTTANDTTRKGVAIIKLYDDFKYYGGNINPKTKKISDNFGIMCQKTGIYYLTIKFKDGEEGCAVVMLSMKKKKKKYEWEQESTSPK